MARAHPYYADKGLSAAFYDAVTGVDTRLEGDIAIYDRLAVADAQVLELGCGAGRVAFAERALALRKIQISPTRNPL